MADWTALAPVDIAARIEAHHAAQWLARIARANIPPQHDDSHTNLGWNAAAGALVTHELGNGLRVALRVEAMTLVAGADEFPLTGKTDAEAGIWADRIAREAGLTAPSGVSLPYEVPGSFARYSAQGATLASWFAAASESLEEARAALAPGVAAMSPVRCWPHHFDMATLASLTRAGGENAPSINLGMSPGDASYAEPYFYASPWPRPAGAMPIPIGHWDTHGYFVATADDILTQPERRTAVRVFLGAAVAACRDLLAKTNPR